MLAGVDVSGDQLSGNHKFMGLVIGTNESIMSIYKRMGPGPIHMSRLHPRRRNAVMGEITFDGASCVGLCMRIEKNLILSKVASQLKLNNDYLNHKKLSRTYDSLLWSMVRGRVVEFLCAHGSEPNHLSIQCDHDCEVFVKDRGCRPENRGPAYELADALAWANRRGMEPRGAVRLDLARPIEAQMLKRFK